MPTPTSKDAKQALYAVAGAADLAVSTIRHLPADAAKLQKEYKRERKGAVRELRKDANFIAREQLREKREKDAAYEKKQKRLIAEIQGEEGREAKEYQREKMKRKGQR